MEIDIEKALQAFDGRRIAPLAALLSERPEARRVLEYLPGRHEVAASWVLKAKAERGQLAPAELAAFLSRLPLLSDAAAILHLLQTARYAPRPAARALRDDMLPLYGHKNGLVRVWAFDAYIRGADHPGELEDTRERIAQGLKVRDPAMRARARGLAQELKIVL